MRKKRSELSNLAHFALALTLTCALAVAMTGCFENNSISKFASSAGSSSSSTSSATQLSISNVTFSKSSSTYLAQLFFNTTVGNATTYCNVSNAPCSCNFSWTQVNTTSGTSVSIPRSVQTIATSAQPGQLTCNAPDQFSTITTGTVLSVSVLPASGNGNSFSSNTFPYTVGATATSSDFQDSQGNSFQDILRYTCYDETARSMQVASAMQTSQDPSGSGTSVTYPMATQFCVQTSSSLGSGTGSASQQCTGQLGAADISSQSYYYNLYIRDSEAGDINYSNQRYVCPTVKQALGNNGTVGTENKAWPLDRTFALALGPSATFNVGVEAYTALSNGGSDPVTAPSTCFSSSNSAPAGTSNDFSLINSCLGYAASPNADGTCPSFTDSTGQTHLTYRLRRYIAIYPRMFDSDGTPLQVAQASDTIYVLDRPVNSPNPLKPYTMQGPKPCPFAYYDRTGVATNVTDASFGGQEPDGGLGVAQYPNSLVPGYVATNNNNWSGKNIDGVQIPNFDSPNSCSAVVGVMGSSNTILSLATVNAVNPEFKEVFIRPVAPWAPHYIEDTSFQACAPQSNPMQDPPLHFARDSSSGNVGWCAEVYPTQNPNVGSIDHTFTNPASSNYIGDVTPFTSHISKNSASATCTPDIPPLPAHYTTGVADHNITALTYPGATSTINTTQTCDRTVSATATPNWTKFPLLAPPQDVESAITSDISDYGCIITYDQSGAKTGKASPSSGCCQLTNVNVATGTGLPAATSTAHLEPDVQCQSPTY